MSNRSFDYSNITYANKKSKLTLKSKRKLDELARQVALWDQDSFYKKRDFTPGITKMNLNPRRSKIFIDEKSKPFNENSNENSSTITPVKANNTGNGQVKKKAAFFESLGTPQRNPINKIAYTPYKNPLTPFRSIPLNQEKNILKDTVNIEKLNKTDKKLFGNKENILPSDTSLLTPQGNIINETAYSHYKSPITAIRTIALNQEKNILQNKEDKIVFDLSNKENTHLSEDEYMPPPPSTDCSDRDSSNTSSITSTEDCSANILKENLKSTKQYLSEPPLIENMSFKVDLNRSMSITHDIENLIRMKYSSDKNDEEVTPFITKSKSIKSVRRSLSWSDSIQYISPSESEGEVIQSIKHDQIDSSDIVNDKHSQNLFDSSSLQSNLSDMSIQSNDSEFEIMIKRNQKNAAINSKYRLTDVQNILKDPTNNLAGLNHTTSCIELVKSCLVQQSLAEKVKSGSDSSTVIEGYLEMQKISLNVKEGFVLIDYEFLDKTNRSNDLQQLKQLYHVVLMVRSHGDVNIKASMVYTIITKAEAYRLKLPHESLIWLEMYEYIKFNNLRPEFKFMFDLYCMEATPKKYIYSNITPKRTPLKKLWFGSRSTEKVKVPAISNRILFFTNIGSFTVTANGLLNTSQKHTATLGVHVDSPFSGTIAFTSQFSMNLVQECRGRLNIFSDDDGIGKWSFYDCVLTNSNILGWKNSDIDKADLILPLHLFLEQAKLCPYNVCAIENSFSVMLDPLIKLSDVPCNRRKSRDGKNKRRFLAAAETSEDTIKWCRSINLTKDALYRWTQCLNSESDF